MALNKGKKKELLERIGGTYKDQYEHAHALFAFMRELPFEEQLVAFEEILVKTGHHDTKKSGKRYNIPSLSEEATERLKIGLGKLVDGHFQFCLAKRPSPTELAKHMWEMINNLGTDEEKIFSIGWLIIDRVVPYVQIPQGGVRLNKDTFRAIVDQNRIKIRMLEKILKWPALQDSERMSLCLGVILENTSQEEQAVLLTAVVRQLQDDAMATAQT